MEITYLGHSCYLLQNNNVTVLTDPYTGVGYELPKDTRADIVTVSHHHFDHCYIDGVKTENVIDGVGKSVVKGMEFYGVETAHDELGGKKRGKNIVYTFTMDGVRICHLGDIGEPCSAAFVKELGAVDILMVPVGGNYTIDCEEAKAYIQAISPKITLLMHYRPTDGTIDILDEQAVLFAFGENVKVVKGRLQVTAQTQGLILMERIKL